MADEKTEKSRAIDLTLSQIEKQFGKGSIMKLGSKGAVVPISVISTGAISFDAALGVGGFPRGRVVEIFGPESSGQDDHRAAGDCRGPEAGRHGRVRGRRARS